MKKSDAIEIFKTQAELARALGITRAAIHQWPDELTQRQSDEVTGAALRLGLIPVAADVSGGAVAAQQQAA